MAEPIVPIPGDSGSDPQPRGPQPRRLTAEEAGLADPPPREPVTVPESISSSYEEEGLMSPVGGGPPSEAGTSALSSPVDREAEEAYDRGQDPEPLRVDRVTLIYRIREDGAKDKPGEEWTQDMVKMGVGDKNVIVTDRSVKTNVTDPSNPGIKMEGGGTSEINSVGQVSFDADASSMVMKDQVINPRMKQVGTSMVVHYKPLIRTPKPWVIKLLKGIMVPLKIAADQLKEE